MKISYRLFVAIFGAVALSLLSVPKSVAQCGGTRKPLMTPSSWQTQSGRPRLLLASMNDRDDDRDEGKASIVGFWHVKFVSLGSPGVPDGAEVDAGYSQWHSDGTEIMNSGHFAPNQSNFCLGVWAKTGPRQFKLNHFATYWDPTQGPIGLAGPTGVLVGPANVREIVTLDRDGDHFSGQFMIDQYDEAGHKLAHLQEYHWKQDYGRHACRKYFLVNRRRGASLRRTRDGAPVSLAISSGGICGAGALSRGPDCARR